MIHQALHRFAASLSGRLLLHLLFWLGVAGFMLFFFGHFTADYHNTFLFVCLLMPITIGTTYLINYLLIPRYLLQKRYLRFACYFAFTLILSVWANMLIIVWTFASLANYHYGNMNPLTGDIFFVVVALYVVVFFSSSVKLLRHWHKSQQHISELRSLQLEAALKLKEAELQLLRGQIHPHFLFNTLNNLYGLALEQSEQMPDAILRLSGLLDALLYRSHAPQVILSSEFKLIDDYVKLEKLRFEERLEVKWDQEGDSDEWSVAPFLLFPFLENAFKHGFSGDTEQQLRLEVKSCIREGQLFFSVSNSISAWKQEQPSLPGGIGLSNLQKRLELLYPQRYRLSTNAGPDLYQVELQLQLTLVNSLQHAFTTSP